MIAENQYEEAYSEGACMSQVSDFMHRGTEQLSHIIEDRPGRSILFASLAGFGIGLIISRMMAAQQTPLRSSFDRSTAERFGRQLLERVEHAMPAMLREKLGR